MYVCDVIRRAYSIITRRTGRRNAVNLVKIKVGRLSELGRHVFSSLLLKRLPHLLLQNAA